MKEIKEAIEKILTSQIEEVRVFVDRCARDKGMAGIEFDKWIAESPKLSDVAFLHLLSLVAEKQQESDEKLGMVKLVEDPVIGHKVAKVNLSIVPLVTESLTNQEEGK